MNYRLVLASIVLLCAIVAFVVGIGFVLQPAQSTLGIFVTCGSAAVGTAAILSGFKDAYDLMERLSRKKTRHALRLPKGIAKDVLWQLSNFDETGIETDLFLTYLARTHGSMRREERLNVLEELKTKGYLASQAGRVRITQIGRQFVHRD